MYGWTEKNEADVYQCLQHIYSYLVIFTKIQRDIDNTMMEEREPKMRAYNVLLNLSRRHFFFSNPCVQKSLCIYLYIYPSDSPPSIDTLSHSEAAQEENWTS